MGYYVKSTVSSLLWSALLIVSLRPSQALSSISSSSPSLSSKKSSSPAPPDVVTASLDDILPKDDDPNDSFFRHDPPYLALITNRNACDSRAHFERACLQLTRALETTKVDLVSVRLTKSTGDPDLVKRLIGYLVDLQACPVVVHHDWLEEALVAQAHGIHMKEFQWRDPALLSKIQASYRTAHLPPPLLGTTCHSLESALEAATMVHQHQYHHHQQQDHVHDNPQPPPPLMKLDYLFVGSCYFSGDSHPEKTELEGPALPGQVAVALAAWPGATPHAPLAATTPAVLAIGGLEARNCHEPLQLGAHGVTVIRSVLQADDPAESVMHIWNQLQRAANNKTPESGI